jgi:cytochrome P450
LAKSFTSGFIEEIHAAMSQHVERLLGELQQAGTVDFVAQFAYPLSSLVMSNLLGLEAKHHQTFRDVSAAIARFPTAVLHGDFSEVVRIGVCLRQAELVLEELMLRRRATPTADLISRLANEDDADSRLSDDEIIVLCNFLLTSGHEIAANLLSGSVCHLLSERRLWDQLLEHPKILGNATEELLRFISPILWIPRIMTKDTKLDGHILRKGSRVYLGIGAANHDPSEFTDPDTLDLTRFKPHSLAFGY